MKIDPRITVSFCPSISLSESEARALDAICGYGDEQFLKVFKEQLGKSYIAGHEDGLKSLFNSVRCHISPLLSQITKCRNELGA